MFVRFSCLQYQIQTKPFLKLGKKWSLAINARLRHLRDLFIPCILSFRILFLPPNRKDFDLKICNEILKKGFVTWFSIGCKKTILGCDIAMRFKIRFRTCDVFLKLNQINFSVKAEKRKLTKAKPRKDHNKLIGLVFPLWMCLRSKQQLRLFLNVFFFLLSKHALHLSKQDFYPLKFSP